MMTDNRYINDVWTERNLIGGRWVTIKEIPRAVKEAGKILPLIMIKSNLDNDPCIDDVDIKTDNTEGAVKFIVLGIIVCLILGIIK